MQLYISMHACVHSLFSPILVLAIENKLTFQLFMFCFFKPVKNTWRRTLRGQATLTSCQSSWLTRPPFSFAFPFFSSPFIQFLPVSETLRHSFGGVWDGKLWDECHKHSHIWSPVLLAAIFHDLFMLWSPENTDRISRIYCIPLNVMKHGKF